jgi:citrate lyase subunit beta / citryl-CoA lyase
VSSAETLLRHRSYLYAPGHRPDVMRKALRAGADAVVLDLEDAVPPEQRPTARQAITDLLDEDPPGGTSVHVRINRHGDGYDADDLRAVVHPRLEALRLPKVEDVDALRQLDRELDELERDRQLTPGAIALYPIIESALGAVRIPELVHASPRLARFAIGTSDLLADLDARGDDDLATLHIRSQLVVHSRAAGLGGPIDSVHTDLSDTDGVRDAALRARSLGFYGKSLIHPRQLAATHEVFTPTADELDAARRIVEAHERGSDAQQLDGHFIDAAVVARARATLRQGPDHG